MLISKLDIRGFGRLTGPFAFAPGLNVVVGDNESGKSTLHDALIRALFGFSKSERRMRDGRTKKDDRKPWDGDEVTAEVLGKGNEVQFGGPRPVKWCARLSASSSPDGQAAAAIAITSSTWSAGSASALVMLSALM